MLGKNDIIKMFKEINFSKDEYWISSGAGLVLHGVKDIANDIDLGCTRKLFQELLEQGYKYKTLQDGTRVILINDSIEILENWYVDKVIIVDGLPVASLDSIKKQKAKLAREKDLNDIKMIDEYIRDNIRESGSKFN